MSIRLIYLIFFILLINFKAYSIEDSDSSNETDTTSSSLNILFDNKSDLDTTVIYSAADSVIFSPKKRTMRLRGNAEVNYGKDNLKSELMIFDMGNSLMYSYSMEDSLGRPYGFPNYNENESEYFAKSIKFNFKTKKGIINFGETELSEGFAFGENIKRISDDAFFIGNGYYTTCDAPSPHYHFGSPEMKVVSNSEFFLDPLIFYVEDIPIFIYPFGIFIQNKKGRQSGLVVPSFAFSNGRGVIFEDLGFYWATSDYFDTQISTNIYTKGGYLLKNTSRWNVKDKFRGNSSIEFGRTRFNTDEEYVQAWRLLLNHDHTITPYQRANVNLNFASSDFNRNTTANINDRITQNITSNASYNINFDNGSSLSLGFNRDQNLINESYTQSVPLTYNLPNLKLARLFNKDVIFKNTSRLNYNLTSSQRISDVDTTFVKEERKFISHTPSITFNLPKLYYFNLTPSFNFGVNNYFRRLTRIFNEETGRVEDSFENGFFTEYWYNYGINFQTRLYGILNFNNSKLKAIRHTFEPNISYRINPDFSGGNFGFYDSYFNPQLNRDVVYNRFERDGGTHASSSLNQNIGFVLNNRFDAKIISDSTDENLELLQLNISGNYNLAADSLKFSDINLSFRTPAINFVNFNGNANFTLYDEDKITDEIRNSSFYNRVNRYLISSGKGLARLTNLTLALSTSFNSDGIYVSNAFGEEVPIEDSLETTRDLGDRFRNKVLNDEAERNLFGQCNSGYQPLSVPWSVNIGVNFRYIRPTLDRINRTLNLNAEFRVRLTETLNFDFNTLYDLVNKQFLNTSLNLTKDMHCWNLSFRWFPVGFNRGFYLRFGIKASQLSDLQLEKRDDPTFR